MENITTKAAIFAQGGMDIEAATSLLGASESASKTTGSNVEKDGNRKMKFINPIKHVSQVIAGAIVLVILSPFLVIASIAIITSSISYVLFEQNRSGLKPQNIIKFKFRKTGQYAEEINTGYENQGAYMETESNAQHDPGITVDGMILQKTNTTIAHYKRFQMNKLLVTPAQKGTWQILPDGNEVNLKNWTKTEIHCTDDRSIKGDAVLFLKTFRTVLLTRSY